MPIVNRIQLDHMVIRDLFDKYPQFEVQVRDAAVSSALKGRVKIKVEGQLDKIASDLGAVILRDFIDITKPRGAQSLKPQYADRVKEACRAVIDNEIEDQVSGIKENLIRQFNDRLAEVRRGYEKNIEVRIASLVDRSIPGMVERLVKEKLDGLYHSLAPSKECDT